MLDDCNEAGNDLVHEDDTTLNWETVYVTSGAGEPTRITRQQIGRERLQLLEPQRRKFKHKHQPLKEDERRSLM